MSTTATYQALVSWQPSTYWHTETFGSTIYDDISADVKSISIRRGRSSDMGQMQAGACTIRLKDTTGKYNAENASAPFVSYLDVERPVKITALYPDTNLFANPGFETAGVGGAGDQFADWAEGGTDGSGTRTTTAGEFHGGVAGCKLTAGPTRDRYVSQSATVTPDATYTLRFWTRAAEYIVGRYLIRDVTNAVDIQALTDAGTSYATTDWRFIERTFTAPAGCTQVSLSLYCPDEDGVAVCFDDVTLSQSYPLFYGYTRAIEHDPEAMESTIEAVDLSFALNCARPAIGEDPAFLDASVGSLMAWILETLLLDSAVWGDFDAGRTIPWFDPEGESSALSLLGNLVEVDQGMLFVAADGVLTYRDTNTLYRQAGYLPTFTGDMVSGLRSGISDDGMINRQTVTRTGILGAPDGTPQTAVYAAPPGEAMLLVRPGSDLSSPYIATDAQAYALAQFVVTRNGPPQSPARQINLINGDETRLEQMLTRELGDLVTISETKGGTAFSGWVESIQHEITNGGLIHKTTFAVRKRPFAWFTIGVSRLDGADLIGFY